MVILTSTSGIFRWKSSSPEKLYSLHELPNMPFLVMLPRKQRVAWHEDVLYFVYEYDVTAFEWVNDCLQFAEGLLLKRPGYSKQQAVSHALPTVAEKPRVFGYQDKGNLQIANNPNFNWECNANPPLSHAYAIVRKVLQPQDIPYHVAYVLAKDGEWNITLEANAEDPSRQQPHFCMYSVDPTSPYNFYNFYTSLGMYPASALILEVRRNKV